MVGLAVIACAIPVSALAGDAATDADADEYRGAASHPPATCFWEGPISTKRKTTRGFDGRYFNFPEESATYWLARLNLPAGSKLILRGRYPHGRYMSLNSYSDGAPTDALSDIAIEARPNATNPFIEGARRDARKRGWRVQVLNEPPPPAPESREPNTLYAEPATGAAIELAYRVYEPDRGYDLTGGTGLPRAKLVMDGGESVSGEEACNAVNDPNREITVQTIPGAVWQAARATPPCDANTNPAYDPVRWERFFNVNYASLAVISDCTAAGRQARLAMGAESQGGFYSNRDSAYVFSHMSRDFGPVMVVNGTLPRSPQTIDGPRRMPGGELRFWSLCTGESRVTTRTPDCLADRQVLAQSGRDYTIVVSRRADRPRNARARCGIAWLDWGNRGDGAGDADYGLLIMRNMLVSPDFDEAIQNVPAPGQEEAVMGQHFPRSSYSTVEEFEDRGC
ncbi:MAG: hypothetical protein QOI31_321 [Solirubrobacterales bacterium]|nr:hypothetical protein [Solirubrobacterales bacterium]